MTLQEIVNRILANHFEIPFETLVNGNEKGLSEVAIFKERLVDPLEERVGEEPLTEEQIIEEHILKDMRDHGYTTPEERSLQVRLLRYDDWFNTPLKDRTQDEILEYRESKES